MPNQLKIFNNSKFGQVRFIIVDGKEYAVGIDIARALEYSNPSKAVIDHCKGITKLGIPSEGGVQGTNVIPEGDIYRLIVKAAEQSKNLDIKAKAEQFEKWIFDEIIPSIRKHGMYAKDELLDNPDLMIEVLTQLKREREEKKFLQTENKLLSQQTLTWANRKLLDAIIKAYGASIKMPEINGFQEAWRDFKKELLYAHSININSRITNYINNSGKKTKPATLDMIHDEELSKCISTAVALCKSHRVDISEIIAKNQSLA